MAHEVDVRTLRKPEKHPTIFAAFDALGVGESFELVNNHNPLHLRDEFETDHPDAYSWEYVDEGPEVWRIRIGKTVETQPRRADDSDLGGRTSLPLSE